MNKVISISERGALTLPVELRERLGVKRGGHLIAEMGKSGEVVLRPGIVVPVEIYSEAQIEEFKRMNETPLAGKKLRWRKGR